MPNNKKAAGAAKPLTKTTLIASLADAAGLTHKQVASVLESLAAEASNELVAHGKFTVPGVAKLTLTEKPATKAREGTNPFTKQPTTFAAKPASKKIRVSAVKTLKDAVA